MSGIGFDVYKTIRMKNRSCYEFEMSRICCLVGGGYSRSASARPWAMRADIPIPPMPFPPMRIPG